MHKKTKQFACINCFNFSFISFVLICEKSVNLITVNLLNPNVYIFLFDELFSASPEVSDPVVNC